MNTRRRKIVLWSVAVYDRMLSLYPRAHQRDYRAQMLQTFSDLICDTIQKRGVRALPAVWIAMLVDTGSNVWTEHVAERSANMGSLKLWWNNKKSAELLDPFWGGFFFGIVFCAMTASGIILISLGATDSIEAWLGLGLIVGAIAGIIAQILQKPAYDKQLAQKLS